MAFTGVLFVTLGCPGGGNLAFRSPRCHLRIHDNYSEGCLTPLSVVHSGVPDKICQVIRRWVEGWGQSTHLLTHFRWTTGNFFWVKKVLQEVPLCHDGPALLRRCP